MTSHRQSERKSGVSMICDQMRCWTSISDILDVEFPRCSISFSIDGSKPQCIQNLICIIWASFGHYCQKEIQIILVKFFEKTWQCLNNTVACEYWLSVYQTIVIMFLVIRILSIDWSTNTSLPWQMTLISISGAFSLS